MSQDKSMQQKCLEAIHTAMSQALMAQDSNAIAELNKCEQLYHKGYQSQKFLQQIQAIPISAYPFASGVGPQKLETLTCSTR